MNLANGPYTLIELSNWESEVSSKILSMRDVHVIGVDQSRNKVSIGVKNKAVREEAVKELDLLNISSDVVLFYQMTPPQLLPGR